MQPVASNSTRLNKTTAGSDFLDCSCTFLLENFDAEFLRNRERLTQIWTDVNVMLPFELLSNREFDLENLLSRFVEEK